MCGKEIGVQIEKGYGYNIIKVKCAARRRMENRIYVTAASRSIVDVIGAKRQRKPWKSGSNYDA